MLPPGGKGPLSVRRWMGRVGPAGATRARTQFRFNKLAKQEPQSDLSLYTPPMFAAPMLIPYYRTLRDYSLDVWRGNRGGLLESVCMCVCVTGGGKGG